MSEKIKITDTRGCHELQFRLNEPPCSPDIEIYVGAQGPQIYKKLDKGASLSEIFDEYDLGEKFDFDKYHISLHCESVDEFESVWKCKKKNNV